MSDFVSQLGQALQMAASPDAAQRSVGEQQMNLWKSQNFPGYLQSLAFLLLTESAGVYNSGNLRMLAGLVLKNEVKRAVSKEVLALVDSATLQRLCDSALRAVLQQSGSDLPVRRQAAQVVSSLVSLSRRLNTPWASTDLYTPLLQAVQSGNAETKEAVLVTLGYVCEENKELLASDDVNSILTGLVVGARDEGAAVKKAALKALVQAIPLAEPNFQRTAERDMMVAVAVEAVRSTGGDVGVAGMECLITMVSCHYVQMLPCMGGLVQLCLAVIPAGDTLGMYGIEFWSALCDEELYLLEEGEVEVCAGIVEKSLSALLPVLTACLLVDAAGTTNDEDEEEDVDEWGMRMASAACLSLVAQLVGDKVVEPVLQFVNANFGSVNREAAILAYGSILDGPSTDKLAPLIDASFPHIVRLLEDPSVAVRDSTGWCIGRIVQLHWRACGKFVQDLMEVLLRVLVNDKIRVAVQIAWVLDNIGSNMGGMSDTMANVIVTCLLQVAASRPNKRLAGACYSAVGSLCGQSSVADKVLDELVRRLSETAPADAEMMGYLCGCIQQCVSVSGVSVHSLDKPVRLLLEMLRVLDGDPVVEDALMALASIFRKLAKTDRPPQAVAATVSAVVAILGRGQSSGYGVMAASIGLIGDLARGGLERSMVEELMRLLVSIVQRGDVDKRLKPLVIVCMGDLALTSDISGYVGGILGLLGQAGRTRLEDGAVDDVEWIDYLNELREAVVESLAGIVHSLRQVGKQELFKEHVVVVIGIVEMILDDVTARKQVQKTAIQLVGDMVMAFQAELALFVKTHSVYNKINNWTKSIYSEELRDSGQWTIKAIHRFSP